jgi:Zn-dependent protease
VDAARLVEPRVGIDRFRTGPDRSIGAVTKRAPQIRSVRAGGLSLGRPFGIPVFVSSSWFLVAAYITYSFAGVVDTQVGDLGPARYAVSATFAILVFLSVVAHELGHCVVSRSFGLPVRRLTIFLLGGLSEIEREPETPGRDYLVAVVGPLISLLLAGVGFALGRAMAPDGVPHLLVDLTAWSNLLVAAFNLLPGLPLDGGRILRAGLWRLTADKTAGTRAAGHVGRGVAVLVLLLAGLSAYDGRTGTPRLTGNLVLLLLLAMFMYSGSGQALRSAAVARRLPGVSVRALARQPVLVSGDLPLSEAVRRANESGARGIVVIDAGGQPYGVVSEAAVASTPEQRRPWVLVSTLARTLQPGLLVDADLRGSAVLDLMRATPASEYVVTERDGSVVGVLTAGDVAAALGTAATR